MTSKYVDTTSIIQVIGNIYNFPKLLDNEKYFFNEEDFVEKFHKIIFGTIYNLHQMGIKDININTIEDYLSKRPKNYAIYQSNKGQEYLANLSNIVEISTFDYYYQKMKKMTLLRSYNKIAGMDLSWLYDPDNILDIKKKQQQEDWLDNTPLAEIADLIDSKISNIRSKYANGFDESTSQAGEDIEELINKLIESPEIGYPLYGSIINTLVRGARLKKFYLRSAASGLGKTRAMVADACFIACNEIYDSSKQQWVNNNTQEPTLFIATEQDLEEIQTLMLAFLSNVDESHILDGEYYDGEIERIKHAAKILKESPIYVAHLPDFSLSDIENIIKSEIHEHNIRYVFFDYIHSSLKILSEISSKSQVKGLREDNVLFMLSTKIKDLCNQYGVFILSSTQLNGDYRSAQRYDQNLLRGAKAIADRIDVGMIMLEPSDEDLVALAGVLDKGGFAQPNIKIALYKNRRGKYKDVLIWCYMNKGTCRTNPMFVTDYKYELLPIEATKIKVKPIKESAF